jgi:hypothetical protein
MNEHVHSKKKTSVKKRVNVKKALRKHIADIIVRDVITNSMLPSEYTFIPICDYGLLDGGVVRITNMDGEQSIYSPSAWSRIELL